MGQKVNPHSFRIGTVFNWNSRWFATGRAYRQQLIQDIKIRRLLDKELASAGLAKTEITRSINTINVILHASRPGVVIGRGGQNLKHLQTELEKLIKKETTKQKVELDVRQIEQPDLEAQLVAQRLADQLVHRYPHRRAVAQAIRRTMDAGAKGIKVQFAGRVAGAEISRTEKYSEGTIPAQTLRADISYASVPALTRSGYIGIKVWINRGLKKI
jgi:small subunit ribosomal protein S3